MPRRRRNPLAFTLIELLVVVGIITILVGILLPTLNRARQSANTVVCMAQARNIMQGLLIYANENNGSMPYNFCWRTSINGITPVRTGADYFGTKGVPQSNDYFWAQSYRWCKIVSDAASHSSESGLFPFTSSLAQMTLNKAFICPEVKALGYYAEDVNQCYAPNPVILVNRPFELAPNGAPENYIAGIMSRSPVNWAAGGGTATPIAPAKLSQLYADNAVFWDTMIVNGSFTATGTSFTPANCLGGFGMSSIDGGQMADPQLAYHRYRNLIPGSWNKPVKPIDQPGQPILYHTRRYEQAKGLGTGAGARFVNQDPFNGFLSPIDQSGNARFRHNNNKVCTVAFADGSVRGLTLSVEKVAYNDTTTPLPLMGGPFGESAQSDFLRSYLQIKPPGVLPMPQNMAQR